MTSAMECDGVRWVEPKTVAVAVSVSPAVVWAWARSRLVATRRLPGRRGRLRIAVDRAGFPLPHLPGPRRARRRS